MLRDPVHPDVPQTVTGSKSCQESGAGEERSCSHIISIHVTAKVAVGSFHVAHSEPQIWLILCHFRGTRRYFWDCSYFSLPSCSVYPLSCANVKPDAGTSEYTSLFSFSLNHCTLFFLLICGGETVLLAALI